MLADTYDIPLTEEDWAQAKADCARHPGDRAPRCILSLCGGKLPGIKAAYTSVAGMILMDTENQTASYSLDGVGIDWVEHFDYLNSQFPTYLARTVHITKRYQPPPISSNF